MDFLSFKVFVVRAADLREHWGNDGADQIAQLMSMLTAKDLTPLLDVAKRLAAPFDLQTMLVEVVIAAKKVLDADRCSLWLYEGDTDYLVLNVATDLDTVRVPAGTGIVGSCARTRNIINVPDCYADPRFNADLDKKSNYVTRCMLTLPLVDHKGHLVGVMQVLNKADGVFDQSDEILATALAAQCAVALQRAKMTEVLIEGEKMRQELETARAVQMSTLPAAMPAIAGYDVFGTSQPADMTGGDTFDVAHLERGSVLVVLGDATGHGLAPALHVTQMHAMLRMALRLGADLDSAYLHLNNQLADILPADRFITAFIGLLDTKTHILSYHSGGQGPLLHFVSATGTWQHYMPTSFPLAAMPIARMKPAREMLLGLGDMLVLLSDGIYEYHNKAGEMFGEIRVKDIVLANKHASAKNLATALLEAVSQFADGAPQEDDITLLLVKRDPVSTTLRRQFERRIDALEGIFEFTASGFATLGIDSTLLQAIDFTIEELFTNMVKYSTMSQSNINIELRAIDAGVEVTLADRDVDRFDVTAAPDVDISRPIEERKPGGLGLHLIRRLVDSIDYAYLAETRESRTRFCKTLATTVSK